MIQPAPDDRQHARETPDEMMPDPRGTRVVFSRRLTGSTVHFPPFPHPAARTTAQERCQGGYRAHRRERLRRQRPAQGRPGRHHLRDEARVRRGVRRLGAAHRRAHQRVVLLRGVDVQETPELQLLLDGGVRGAGGVHGRLRRRRGGHGHARRAPQGALREIRTSGDRHGGVRGDRQDRLQVPQLRHGHRVA